MDGDDILWLLHMNIGQWWIITGLSLIDENDMTITYGLSLNDILCLDHDQKHFNDYVI